MPYDSSGFNWPQYKDQLNKLVHDTSAEIRAIRPLLTLYGKQGGFIPAIVGHRVSPGPPLTVSTTQNLTPVTLRCKWQVTSTQFTDDEALNCLAVEAAYRVAAAEEAVILLGGGATEFLNSLGVESDNLGLKE